MAEKKKMKRTLIHTILALLALLRWSEGFQPSLIPSTRTKQTTSSSPLSVVLGDEEHVLEKTQRYLQDAPPLDERLDNMIKSIFPNALNNCDLEYRVVATLAERGFTAANTLLATSLCSDEVAKTLVDDFVNIYGSNYNLGGLAGFPFAGNTGFQTMSGHIPDTGCCLLIYGPHVGVTRDGTIGKVEREGVTVDDICCRSAMEASNYVMGVGEGVSPENMFLDFQQGAVQNLVVPLSDRLQASQYPNLELPYAIYDSQTELVDNIVSENIAGIKEGGIAILGGVQINTGPDTPDYFHPLRFELINSQGELVEYLLSQIA